MGYGDRSVAFLHEHTHTHTHIKQCETDVEKERSTSKYRETKYAEKSGARIPNPSLKKRSENRDVDEL